MNMTPVPRTTSTRATISSLFVAVGIMAAATAPARAECAGQQCRCGPGDWLHDVGLPAMGCSPQSIQQICSGQRPVPQTGSCPDMEIAAPPAPIAGGTPYQNFEQLAARSGLRPASEAYFNERTQSYCSLLNDGNFTEMMSQVSFPPGIDPTETAQNRSRLEVAILMTGVPAACPGQTGKMQQFVASIMR